MALFSLLETGAQLEGAREGDAVGEARWSPQDWLRVDVSAAAGEYASPSIQAWLDAWRDGGGGSSGEPDVAFAGQGFLCGELQGKPWAAAGVAEPSAFRDALWGLEDGEVLLGSGQRTPPQLPVLAGALLQSGSDAGTDDELADELALFRAYLRTRALRGAGAPGEPVLATGAALPKCIARAGYGDGMLHSWAAAVGAEAAVGGSCCDVGAGGLHGGCGGFCAGSQSGQGCVGASLPAREGSSSTADDEWLPASCHAAPLHSKAVLLAEALAASPAGHAQLLSWPAPPPAEVTREHSGSPAAATSNGTAITGRVAERSGSLGVLGGTNAVADISFDSAEGEQTGVAGLDGSQLAVRPASQQALPEVGPAAGSISGSWQAEQVPPLMQSLSPAQPQLSPVPVADSRSWHADAAQSGWQQAGSELWDGACRTGQQGMQRGEDGRSSMRSFQSTTSAALERMLHQTVAEHTSGWEPESGQGTVPVQAADALPAEGQAPAAQLPAAGEAAQGSRQAPAASHQESVGLQSDTLTALEEADILALADDSQQEGAWAAGALQTDSVSSSAAHEELKQSAADVEASQPCLADERSSAAGSAGCGGDQPDQAPPAQPLSPETRAAVQTCSDDEEYVVMGCPATYADSSGGSDCDSQGGWACDTGQVLREYPAPRYSRSIPTLGAQLLQIMLLPF